MTATTLADRALLRIGGEDPRAFLQGLVTSDVTAALPVWAGLLTPQGKALFDFIVWADGADVLLDCERTQAAALARRLAMYRLRRAITIAPEPGLGVHWSRGRPAADTAPDAAPPPPVVVPDPRLPALGWRWLAAPDAAADGWLAHRLQHGVGEGVAELGNGDTLWLECNADLLGGVSFAKGCYVGQENTARMHHRAKVGRRLAVAPLASADPARLRAGYPDLAFAVELRRVADWGDALRPAWLDLTPPA